MTLFIYSPFWKRMHSILEVEKESEIHADKACFIDYLFEYGNEL